MPPCLFRIWAASNYSVSGENVRGGTDLAPPQHRWLTHEQSATKQAVVRANCYYYTSNNMCSPELTSTFKLKCCYVPTSQLVFTPSYTQRIAEGDSSNTFRSTFGCKSSSGDFFFFFFFLMNRFICVCVCIQTQRKNRSDRNGSVIL